MKTVFLASVCVLLMGCASPFVRTVEVIKPVPVKCPEPALIEKPSVPIYQLTEQDKGNYNKIGKAYVESIIRLEDYANSLEQALEVYKQDEKR